MKRFLEVEEQEDLFEIVSSRNVREIAPTNSHDHNYLTVPEQDNANRHSNIEDRNLKGLNYRQKKITGKS